MKTVLTEIKRLNNKIAENRQLDHLALSPAQKIKELKKSIKEHEDDIVECERIIKTLSDAKKILPDLPTSRAWWDYFSAPAEVKKCLESAKGTLKEIKDDLQYDKRELDKLLKKQGR